MLTACASPKRGDVEYAPAVPVSYTGPIQYADSIYHFESSWLLLEDIKPRRVGDMLTVTLQEKTDAKKNADTETKKATDNEISALRFLGSPVTYNDRELLDSVFVADAVIASTATGSTAYAMAAGGPILSPELRNILLVPVAPHLSIEQSLVLSEDVLVSVTVHTSHQAVISIDGQHPIHMLTGDRVEIQASDHIVQFIRFLDPGYFYRNLIPYMDQNPSIKKKNVRNT